MAVRSVGAHVPLPLPMLVQNQLPVVGVGDGVGGNGVGEGLGLFVGEAVGLVVGASALGAGVGAGVGATKQAFLLAGVA